MLASTHPSDAPMPEDVAARRGRADRLPRRADRAQQRAEVAEAARDRLYEVGASANERAASAL